MTTIPALLDQALSTDPGRPFVTYYDLASGERIELSVATTANWVSKTANLLQDSLGAEGGSRIAVDLPPHWTRTVWLLAAWCTGCVVTIGAGSAEDAEVYVTGPGVLTAPPSPAGETVAVSLRPLGARFAEPLPAGVVDYHAEVLGHGDVFSAYAPPGADSPAAVIDDVSLGHADCIDRALERSTSWGTSARVLTDGGDAAADVVELTLAPLVRGGSQVLVANGDAERIAKVGAEERVTDVVTVWA